MSNFTGLHEEMYHFFWELAFNNNPEFFEANRDRYVREVKEPLTALAEALLPTALEIDGRFSTKTSSILSRIRRDTRYSHDKSPYRDHAWLGFRLPGAAISDGLTPYAEFEREYYGYGMGMYYADPQLMQSFRARMLEEPDRFLSIVTNPAFTARFAESGDSYRRPKFTHATEALVPWLNKKRLSFTYTSAQLSRTTKPELLDELVEAFLLLKPVYRFFMRLD